MTRLLHLSDLHLRHGGVPLDDMKEIFDAPVDDRTSAKVLRQTLRTLARFGDDHGSPAIVVVSGDLTVAGHHSGFHASRSYSTSTRRSSPGTARRSSFRRATTMSSGMSNPASPIAMPASSEPRALPAAPRR